MSQPKVGQPQVGDVVIYSRQGRSVNALVLNSREGEVSHLGKNGEPLLTLAFIQFPAPNAPHKRPTVLQAAVHDPEIEIERDVVHASHEFSADFKRQRGIVTEAQIATHRGHGEWAEVQTAENVAAQEEIARLNQLVSDLTSHKDDVADDEPPAA